ncbi:MAG: hypothetical protein DRG11_07455 [Epsilonproteobacteria bacterium]|nr:MAG: hypothetical protein DRG11_07455 [Campylobacterota bacterium]
MRKIVLMTIITSGILFANSGEQLTKDNGCMECHNIMGEKLAPAFMGTAKKNIRWFGNKAKQNLIKGIKDGSKGKYGNFQHTAMPAYGHLNTDELDRIATWILAQYDKNRKLYPNGRNNQQNKSQNRQGKNRQ